MEGILNWRKCKKCGEYYDIGTNFSLCPKCRGIKQEVKGDGESKIY